MKIDVKTTINRPIDEVWTLAADDFTSIQCWSDSVITSEVLTDIQAADGSPTSGRYCTFTDDPKSFETREAITRYDKANYVLEFEVEPVNAPKALPLKKNFKTLTLRVLGPNQTEIHWIAEPKLKFHGYLMAPLLKPGLKKSFSGILKELKEYAEAGGAAAGAEMPHLAAVG